MTTETILAQLKNLGYETVPASFYSRIANWDSWYQGSVPDFHDYRVYNGLRHVRCRKLTAGMAKNVCESWADLLMNSKVTVTLEGKKEQKFFDSVCAANNFRQMMNLFEEYTFALGTSAIVLRLTGVPVDSEGSLLPSAPAAKPSVVMDFIRADGIFPLSWENGVVRECAFATTRTDRGREYLYLQLHLLNPDATYRIENRLFLKPDSSEVLQELSLEDLPTTAQPMSARSATRALHGYASGQPCEAGLLVNRSPSGAPVNPNPFGTGIAPVFHTHSAEPFFFLNTPNIANNLAPDVPMGISVFANAIDQLMDCDNIFDSLNSEFVLGRKRIMVKPEAVRNLDGEPLFDANDLVFYILPEDSTNGSTVQEIKADLRVPEHVSGLQVALDLLGLKCGFGPNHWKFDAGHITTATQILSANSEEYRTQQKHQLVLESLLIRLARTVIRLGKEFLGLPLRPEIPISVDFDNSAIEHLSDTFDRDISMLEHGILSKEEFRQKWMNEDPKTAASALPKTPEPQS